jgi:GMP synthase-like glutamine amidotransferase
LKIAILNLTLPFEDTGAFATTGTEIGNWISPALPEAAFSVIDIANGEPFPAVPDYDGYIVSGSEMGVYDTVEWMEPLRLFLLNSREAGAALVGICFGHQMMAHTFGGRAEKAPLGQVVGARRFTMEGVERNAHVWHQDQVVEVPPAARVTGFADYCPVGMLDYDFPAVSMQFHPEYSRAYMTRGIELLMNRAIDPEAAAEALRSMARVDVPSDLMADRAAATLRRRRT